MSEWNYDMASAPRTSSTIWALTMVTVFGGPPIPTVTRTWWVPDALGGYWSDVKDRPVAWSPVKLDPPPREAATPDDDELGGL